MNGQLLDPELLKKQKEQLLKEWTGQLRQNPEFQSKKSLDQDSLKFLEEIIKTVGTTPVPEINIQEFKPILGLLDKLYTQQLKAGYNEKDVAAAIFSLKSAFVHLNKGQENNPAIADFNRLLDILGLFAFENYAKNRENLLSRQQEEIRYLRNRETDHFGKILGQSDAISKVLEAMNQVLDNDVPVLIMGPTGTGKELVASAIHQNGPRKDKPFVVVNCGAIPENLLESELFGYERGAFTGAIDRHMGKFELANGGILFLDEIGEMTKALQVKLLRVLQEKEVVRLGGHEKIKLDVKFIYATNKDLKSEVKKNNFREDLYYRIHVFPIQMPALKERGHDIILLAEYFLKKMASELKKPIKGFSLEAEQALLNYDWPGNVRELENVINRAVIVAGKERITPQDLNLIPLLEGSSDGVIIDLPGRAISMDESEKITIQKMLREKKGNLKKTAEALGISRTTLYTKARKYKLI